VRQERAEKAEYEHDKHSKHSKFRVKNTFEKKAYIFELNKRRFDVIFGKVKNTTLSLGKQPKHFKSYLFFLEVVLLISLEHI